MNASGYLNIPATFNRKEDTSVPDEPVLPGTEQEFVGLELVITDLSCRSSYAQVCLNIVYWQT
jgi:hypothetical protein